MGKPWSEGLLLRVAAALEADLRHGSSHQLAQPKIYINPLVA
jgi:Asp-tRNA(Asn)/Glu-tRNA(Gln) amidotransferase A subunit family amidase